MSEHQEIMLRSHYADLKVCAERHRVRREARRAHAAEPRRVSRRVWRSLRELPASARRALREGGGAG